MLIRDGLKCKVRFVTAVIIELWREFIDIQPK